MTDPAAIVLCRAPGSKAMEFVTYIAFFAFLAGMWLLMDDVWRIFNSKA